MSVPSFPKLIFFLKDSDLKPHGLVPHETTPHLIHKLARKHRLEDKFTKAPSAGPDSLTNSLLQLQFTEFIIVQGGALQSNQNDNNSQKLQWAVWKD